MSTRTQYEADLAALKESLARMSQLSADAVEDALEGPLHGGRRGSKGHHQGRHRGQPDGAGHRAPLHDPAAASAAGGK